MHTNCLTQETGDVQMTDIRREIAVDRVASSGQRVTVAVCLDASGNAWVESALDGVRQDKVLGLGKLQSPKQHANGLITHYTGKNIAIFADEAGRIESLQDELRAYYETTSEGLLYRRRELLRDIRIARDIDREDRDRAWEREDERGAMRQDASGNVAAAERALADFDAEHPEVLQAWDADSESRREAELDNQAAYKGE